MIITFLSILSLWILWFILWQKYSLDKLREDLFAVRDELFLIAAEKKDKFGFDHQIYKEFEDFINRTIKYSHNISNLNIFLFSSFINKRFKRTLIIKSKFIYDFENYIKYRCNKELVKKLMSLKNKYEYVIISHLIRKSLFIIILLTFRMIFFIIKNHLIKINKADILKKVKIIFKKPLICMEEQAELYA
ncbi:MAG: hypothetical protein JXB50_17010 [Spirochaetes bacterium]|nr:hypothetical protein [Spirochaetota bacterium]